MDTCLFIVPTPIGNLQDITIRAINTLKEVDLILAEDTRTTSILLKKYDIRTSATPYHIHNEHHKVNSFLEDMENGRRLALVSDAGTPGISDPGYLLIHGALGRGLAVEVLPGPTAFVPALLKSGFPSDRFVFEGFLPHKKGRETRWKQLAQEDRTIVLYESPHRLGKALSQIEQHFGKDTEVSVSRELTKKFEETRTGPISELIKHFEGTKPKGEFVIVIKRLSKP